MQQKCHSLIHTNIYISSVAEICGQSKLAHATSGQVRDVIFLNAIAQTLQKPKVETWYATKIWYEDDARTFFV